MEGEDLINVVYQKLIGLYTSCTVSLKQIELYRNNKVMSS